jgi:hypothetical protein
VRPLDEFLEAATANGRKYERIDPGPPAIFHRPPVEKYVRVTIESRGFTLEPAVEWREGDDFDRATAVLESIGEAASAIGWPHQMKAAEECGRRIATHFPDRAYFVEVWHGERKGFAQVFQPYGVPRNTP